MFFRRSRDGLYRFLHRHLVAGWSGGDAQTLFQHVAHGRVDAGFADVSALESFLDKPEGAGFQFVDVNIISTFDPTLGEGVGVGIRQDDADLKAKIDTALCELIADGSIKASSEKWFNMDISRPCQ